MSDVWNADLQPGLVIRVTRYTQGMGNSALDTDWWVVVTQVEYGSDWSHAQLLIDNGVQTDDQNRDLLIVEDDHYEIPPQRQVPDEVWAALATWRLTGDQ